MTWVANVSPGSSADAIGLHRHDVIFTTNTSGREKTGTHDWAR